MREGVVFFGASVAAAAGGGGGVCAAGVAVWEGCCSLTRLEMGWTGATRERVEGAGSWCACGESGAQSEGESLRL